MDDDSKSEEHCNCSILQGACIDIATPVNRHLTAFYKRSFAHYTVKFRMPVILTKLIDSLARSKQEICECYGKGAQDELKAIIGKISKLKHDIQTNKPLLPFDEEKRCEAKLYNNYIKKCLDKSCECLYYNTCWLFVECYMYRRIFECFLESQCLRDYDYFAKNRQESFNDTLSLIKSLANTLTAMCSGGNSTNKELLKPDFIQLLKLNLWGNKCDLSISNGDQSKINDNLTQDLESMDANILCDDSDDIFEALSSFRCGQHEIVDIVLDNAGYELFTDLCLADFIITNKFARTVRLYVKDFPWFISDARKCDFDWMLKEFTKIKDPNLCTLGLKWTNYLKQGVWVIEESCFWTTHVPYHEMLEVDAALYQKLAQSKCTFFKGDLNYRKLLGDRHWNPSTPFEEALEGFHPSRLCSLRTLKADLICGLCEGLAEKIQERDPEWMITGNYGVIQYCGAVRSFSWDFGGRGGNPGKFNAPLSTLFQGSRSQCK